MNYHPVRIKRTRLLILGYADGERARKGWDLAGQQLRHHGSGRVLHDELVSGSVEGRGQLAIVCPDITENRHHLLEVLRVVQLVEFAVVAERVDNPHLEFLDFRTVLEALSIWGGAKGVVSER